MFEVSVEAGFKATHAVTVAGVDEIPHEHDWKAVVLVNGEQLDNDGLVVDFLALEKSLDDIIKPLRDADLNKVDVLDGKNPSAEFVALYIGQEIEKTLPHTNKLVSVTVTEAPHCKAIYKP